MPTLNVNGKQYEGKVSFKFSEVADKKYAKESDQGETDGMHVIYSQLLEGNTSALSSFWDCALSHHKQRPTVDAIQDALEEQGEEDDFDTLFKDAFTAMDESGFFKKRRNNFWKNLELFEKFVKTDEEREAAKLHIQNMKESRAHLIGEEAQ
jgi:Phage tail assembly chaperone protein, TAC